MKRRAKFIAGICVGALMTMFLAGCSNDSKKEESKANIIKIGVNAEMTGPVATFGISSTNAMKLAVKQINAAGGINGKKIELIFADNKSEPAEAAAATTKLIAQDKVKAILGPLISSTTLACTKIAQDSKIPLLTPSATNPLVTEKDGKVNSYVFRGCFIDDFMGSVMAEFASKNINAKTAAVYVDSSSDFSKGLGKVFVDTFAKNNGKIVSQEAFLAKDTDFKATLTKIKATAPEVIFIPANYQEVAMIIKQARELDINVPFVGVDAWDSPKLFEIAGNVALNNTYYASHFSPEDTDPLVQKFVNDYKAEYGVVPDAQAILGYDSVLLLADAIKRAGSDDPDKIKDALATTKDLRVAAGTITMDSHHNPIKPAIINENKDGKVVFKDKITPK